MPKPYFGKCFTSNQGFGSKGYRSWADFHVASFSKKNSTVAAFAALGSGAQNAEAGLKKQPPPPPRRRRVAGSGWSPIDLNAQIASAPGIGFYQGGQGLVVRNLDDGDLGGAPPDELKVVPGTLWHNDIWPPNQIYPANTNIIAGNDCNKNNWLHPTVAVLVNPDKLYPKENWQRVDSSRS